MLSASLRGMELEGKHDRGDPPDEGIETHPQQQERRPSREILLRHPKAQKELEEPGNQAEPPDGVDPLGRDRGDEVERPLEDQQEPKYVGNGDESTDGVDEGP